MSIQPCQAAMYLQYVKNAFAAAKAQIAAAAVASGATDGGAAAVLQVYHADLLPPFCLVAAASFFANY
jgi:hypothetical protein